MYLLNLPSEVLVDIVSHLSARDKLHVRMTCRQLYSVLSDPVFWSSISWEQFNPVRDEKPLKTVLKLGAPLLHELNISALDRFSLYKFRPSLKWCEKLKHLTLTGFKLSSDQLKTLLTILPNIHHLEFDESFKCSYKNFFELAPLSSTLTSVIMSKTCAYVAILKKWCETGFSPPEMGVRIESPLDNSYSCFSSLDSFNTPKHRARFCFYNVQYRHVYLQESFTQSAFEFHFNPDLYIPYSTMFDSRRHIFFLGSSGESFTRAELISIDYRTLPHELAPLPLPNTIRFLNFHGYRDLESVHLSLIANACPNLYQLNLEFCRKALKDLDGLSSIVKQCQNLRSLNISKSHGNSCYYDDKHQGPESRQVWQVLCQARKLTQLAIDVCLLSTSNPHASTHQTQSQLLQSSGPRNGVPLPLLELPETVDQCYENMAQLRGLSIRCDCHLLRNHPELLSALTKFQSLTHLDLDCMKEAPIVDTVKEILLRHKLTYLKLCSTRMSNLCQLILPDDCNCYTYLRFLYIKFQRLHISVEVANAISYHKRLTHITLACYSISSENISTLVYNSPHLVECHLSVQYCVHNDRTLKQFSSGLKSELQKRGVKNSLNLSQRIPPSASTSVLELPSLW